MRYLAIFGQMNERVFCSDEEECGSYLKSAIAYRPMKLLLGTPVKVVSKIELSSC
jgi:hypothetical protein